MIDRTTKALLLAIALGLWVGLAEAWLRPTSVEAQTWIQRRNAPGVAAMDLIANGTCANPKLC